MITTSTVNLYVLLGTNLVERGTCNRVYVECQYVDEVSNVQKRCSLAIVVKVKDLFRKQFKVK